MEFRGHGVSWTGVSWDMEFRGTWSFVDRSFVGHGVSWTGVSWEFRGVSWTEFRGQTELGLSTALKIAKCRSVWRV
jgi:hypothetical protein